MFPPQTSALSPTDSRLSLDAIEFQRNFEVETSYWWNQGRFFLVRRWIRRFFPKHPEQKWVDLGCGTGGTTLWLSGIQPILGVDASPLALQYCRRRGLKKLKRSSLEALKLPSRSFDAAFALDILEHVRDDKKALSEIHRILKNSGLLLMTVPAYQWLWSEHDEVCHHYRRYTQGELTRKIREAGFRIVRSSYCITFLLVPLVLMLRWRWLFKRDRKIMSAVVPLPSWLNLLLIGILKLEAVLLDRLRFPFGVSIICLAQKI